MPVKKSTLIIDGDNRKATKAIQGVTSGLGRAVGDVQKLGGGLTSALSGFTGLLSNTPFLMAAATTAVVGGFLAMVKSSIDVAESLEKMSQRAGVSVEFLSKLRFSAELAGTEIGVTEKALQRMSRGLDDASNGLLTALRPYQQLGIEIEDTNGKLRNAEELFFEVAERFSKMDDGAQKTAYALQIFGRAGADLIPILNQGSDGIREQFELCSLFSSLSAYFYS